MRNLSEKIRSGSSRLYHEVMLPARLAVFDVSFDIKYTLKLKLCKKEESK